MGGLRVGGKAWLAGAALALGGAASLDCRERGEGQGGVQSERELQQAVRQMMPAVERATGLNFKRDPAVLRRTRAQVRDYIIHKFDEDLPPAELQGVQAAYRLFGLIPDSLDLRQTMVDVFTEQIAGYYDPDSNALYVPTDLDPLQLRFVVSHELVHALQDQYVDLDSVIQQKQQNDRRSAAQSILEGQATLAQILVLMPEQRVESLPNFWQMKELLRSQQNQMPVFTRAPLWLRESLLFPYLGGAEFVRWFGQAHAGKQPFGSAMPTSTEQILHPDRYAAGDAPTRLAFVLPSSAPIRYEDNLGEFETRLLFHELLGDEAEATRLAQGWDGDRYAVLGQPPVDALVWYSVWDDEAAAAAFARGLERAAAGRRAEERADRRSRIEQLSVDGMPAVRFVNAPANWSGWKSLPRVRVVSR